MQGSSLHGTPSRAGRDSSPKPSSFGTRFLVSPANTLSTTSRASKGERWESQASSCLPMFTIACKGRICKETRGKAQRDKVITFGEKLFLEKRLGEKSKLIRLLQMHQGFVT